MGFLLKAGFWFVVVLLFLPKNPETLSNQRQLAEDSARSLIDAAQTAARFCQDKPEVCETAAETSKLANTYINLASEHLAEKTKPDE